VNNEMTGGNSGSSQGTVSQFPTMTEYKHDIYIYIYV